jgi:hypothetical protein
MLKPNGSGADPTLSPCLLERPELRFACENPTCGGECASHFADSSQSRNFARRAASASSCARAQAGNLPKGSIWTNSRRPLRACLQTPSSADGSGCKVPRIASKAVDAGPQAQLGRGHQLRVQAADLADNADKIGRRSPLDEAISRYPTRERLLPRQAAGKVARQSRVPYPLQGVRSRARS